MKTRRLRSFWGVPLLALTLIGALSLAVFASPPEAPAPALGQPAASGLSLRFYGHGSGGIDRVRIPIDAPERPADIGATDVTIEFWLRALPGENNGSVACGSNDGWITGNTLLDRDIYFAGDYGDFGIGLGGGRVAFGLSVGNSGTTLCGAESVADGAWHHVAVTRRLNGEMRLFIDGQPDGTTNGPAGDASYRNGRATDYSNDPYIVLGAEKHDAGSAYPSFSGWLDELRLSTSVRYTAAFTPPSRAFTPDAQTAALYHFDEGPAGACDGAVTDSSGAAGGPSNGECRFGGAAPAGPVYSAQSPFGATATATPTRIATRTPTRMPTQTATRMPTPTSSPVARGTRSFLPTINH